MMRMVCRECINTEDAGVLDILLVIVKIKDLAEETFLLKKKHQDLEYQD